MLLSVVVCGLVFAVCCSLLCAVVCYLSSVGSRVWFVVRWCALFAVACLLLFDVDCCSWWLFVVVCSCLLLVVCCCSLIAVVCGCLLVVA